MDIFNHFSCHTRLPVLLEHVVAHIVETGVVASVDIFAVDIDPAYLQGFCWVFLDKPHNSINHHRRAWIGYSDKLTREMARMVICKELLHLLDNHAETAQQREQVEELIEQIVLPPDTAAALPVQSDKQGILLALAIMLPRDAIDELRPRVERGEVSVETISKHARIPERYVRVALTPLWQRVLDSFAAKFPSGPKLDLSS